jgi:hypothetical protein
MHSRINFFLKARPRLAGVFLALALTGYGEVKRVDPPAAKESGMPYLATGADGKVHLSFIDYLGTAGHALRVVRWTGSGWGSVETVSQGKNWFVNWADFPSIAALPDGALLAHWLARPEGGGRYGYGIRIARKDRNGQGWREIHGMNLQGKEDYAGFLTFIPNSPGAIYLAPPAGMKEGAHQHEAGGEEGHRKTVRFVSLGSGPMAAKDLELDADACSCCQTAIGRTRDGYLAAYRDHTAGEIRDISIVRYAKGSWTPPRTLHPDGWKINGCPTDGPSIATQQNQAGIVWLTRAGGQPKVQMVLSHDGGSSFTAPIRVDDGNPLGRASLSLLDRTSYVAIWLEKKDDRKVEIRLRRIAFDGGKSTSLVVAEAPLGRESGFPKVAMSGDQILVTWREGQVRAAVFSKTELMKKELF